MAVNSVNHMISKISYTLTRKQLNT